MTIDATRLRADLLAARRAHRSHDVAAIGSLLTALANAEAVPVADERYHVVEGSADVPRRALRHDDVLAALDAEIEERRSALDHYRRAGVDGSGIEAELGVLERYRLEVA